MPESYPDLDLDAVIDAIQIDISEGGQATSVTRIKAAGDIRTKDGVNDADHTDGVGDPDTRQEETRVQAETVLAAVGDDSEGRAPGPLITPKLPPPPEVLADLRRRSGKQSGEMRAVQPAQSVNHKKNPGAPNVPQEVSKPVQGLRSPTEEAHLRDLLAAYVAGVEGILDTPSIPKTPPPVVSGIRPKKPENKNEFEQAVDELLQIAAAATLDRVNFQVAFRDLVEQYGLPRLNVFFINYLRLKQPFHIDGVGDRDSLWRVSATATLAQESPHSPPRVSVFRKAGESNRALDVDLVYILRGILKI